MARKATLKNTTAVKAPVDEMGVKATGERVPVATFRKNEADTLSENMIKSEVDRALKDNDDGTALLGSSVQRMAYAQMAEHERLVMMNVEVPLLSTMHKSKDALTKFSAMIIVKFIGERPKDSGSDKDKTAVKLYNKHKALFDRGLPLASILRASHVSMDKFNDKTGQWLVPAKLCFPPSFKPTEDSLLNGEILLDNGTYGGWGKNAKGDKAVVSWQASRDQVVRVGMPKTVPVAAADNRTNAGQGNTDTPVIDLDKAKPKDAAKQVNTDSRRLRLIAIYREAIMALMTEPLKWSDLPKTEQGILTDLAKLRDGMMHRDDANSAAKPAAKPAAAA